MHVVQNKLLDESFYLIRRTHNRSYSISFITWENPDVLVKQRMTITFFAYVIYIRPNFTVCGWNPKAKINSKAIEQNFYVVQFVLLHNLVLILESVNKIAIQMACS